MFDVTEFVNAMNRASLGAVSAKNPTEFSFGTVVSDSPLTIQTDQKLELKKAQLILSRNVTDFETEVTVDWKTELEQTTHTHIVQGSDSGGDSFSVESQPQKPEHLHNIIGRKKILVHNALQTGEKVILLREQGGQRYLVWDRVGVW